MSFVQKERARTLKKLAETQFDLCVIGGGITGAGVARDAASRGLKVCVLEQNDFASGTSSKSSKLIHGGVRYLENLEFGLVFEALSERHVLFQIAPHLVHPLTFILPVYKSSRVGMLKLGLGMWLYDVLALFHAPKFHERLSSKGAQALLPTLTPDELKGAYLYSDAYMDDDRLVIETLRSAISAGACVASYVRAGRAQLDHSGKIVSIEATDLESGKSLGMIRARHFISTVGPWTDLVGAGLFKTWKKLLRPSKGVHLVVPAHKIPTKSAVVMAEGKRIIFAIPRGDIVIVGTTDTDYQGNPEDVVTQKQDVDYLLKVVGEYFSGSKLSEADIISSYAGVRPLVNDGSETESKTSREHVIKSTDHNVTFVAGGKYTTYRRMARDIVEVVLKREFPMEDRIKFARNNTREPINPQVTPEKLSRAIAQAPIWAKHYKIAPQISTVLAERHGDEAQKILNDYMIFRDEHPYLTMSLWTMEALFAVRETMCFHLKDFMLRRSPLYLTTKDHGRFCENEVAAVMAIELGWSKEDIEKELADYHAEINRELAWRGNG